MSGEPQGGEAFTASGSRPARARFDLTGRVAVVTGGGGGLGSALAAGLAEQGADVVVTDLDFDAADRVATSIVARGGSAAARRLDVTRPDEVEQCFAAIEAAHGGIDVLVTSAGIGLRRPAVELSPAEWQKVLDVNLSGCWYCDQAAGRRMVGSGGGSIVNVGSVVGQVGIDTGNANYAASKGGVIGLTKCLAVEWATSGVRVNVVAPTHFRTPLVEQAIREIPGVEDRFRSNIPLGRLGEPGEIVGAVVFLASDEASMVTGHVLNVDGGHTAR